MLAQRHDFGQLPPGRVLQLVVIDTFKRIIIDVVLFSQPDHGHPTPTVPVICRADGICDDAPVLLIDVVLARRMFFQCLYRTAERSLAYEFIITLPSEYDFVWRRKWTGATWLFLANRYALLAVIVEATVPFSYQLPVLILAVFSALRVFALLGRAYVTATCVLLLGVASVGLVLYQDAHIIYYYVNIPALGAICPYEFLISPSIVFNVLCAIAADIIVIVTTWIKTYRHVREASSVGMNVSFSATLLQYGTVYFIVLCMVNLLTVLIFLIPSLQLVSPVSNFLEVLPNIVVARFLINLREGNSADASDVGTLSRFSVPNFHIPTLPSIIGNLDQPLASDDIIDEEEPYLGNDICDVTDRGSASGEHEHAWGVPNIDHSEIEKVPEETV
ncbi:hypothetical protein NM688_g6218 [Phlebia brevispora]|uniref:Uncharacterized protein n=1 Tax=Phlebia brevispora TaxID=194682 RepID=A0ACC1SIQ6_9APHY|nr:hypothetical protein NM688_g6218 [Phlebia brevispora]